VSRRSTSGRLRKSRPSLEMPVATRWCAPGRAQGWAVDVGRVMGTEGLRWSFRWKRGHNCRIQPAAQWRPSGCRRRRGCSPSAAPAGNLRLEQHAVPSRGLAAVLAAPVVAVPLGSREDGGKGRWPCASGHTLRGDSPCDLPGLATMGIATSAVQAIELSLTSPHLPVMGFGSLTLHTKAARVLV